jgi:hypothetical protein
VNEENSSSPKPTAQRRTLLILLGVFFLPLAAAFILYYGVGWRPSAGSNHGELLQPVQQLPEGLGGQKGQWTLLYIGDGRCDADCRQALIFARQTRLSLNQEMTRVNRAIVALDNCCDLAYLDKEHEGIKVFALDTDSQREELLALLPPGSLAHWLFIIDPLGNIVMRYDAREEPRGLLTDLKKLLKLSHIG